MLETGLSLAEAIYHPKKEYETPRLVQRIATANSEAWERFKAYSFDLQKIENDSLMIYLRYALKVLRGPLELPPEISVVLPVHNEEKYILGTYIALAAQRTTRRVEIVPVDNNSTRKGDTLGDGSIAGRDDLTLFYSQTLGLNWLSYYEEKNSIGLARQRGVDHAQANIICMTDGDTIIPPDWIETVSAPFFPGHPEYPKVTVASGDVHYCDPITIFNPLIKEFQPTRVNAAIAPLRRLHLARRPVPMGWAYGPNLAFRRSDLYRVGGFPFTSSNEDLDVINRLSQLGEVKAIDCPGGAAWVSARRLTPQTLVPILLSAVIGKDLIHTHKNGAPKVIR